MKIPALGAITCCCVMWPLAAQAHIETGGGAAHLDQLPSSSLASFGGGLDALFGPARLAFAGTADNHLGLGVAGTVGGGLHYRFTPGGWRLELGPVVEAARGIGEQWTSTFAGEVAAERDIGKLTLRGSLQQGILNTGPHREPWRRPSIGAEFQVGALRLGALWQSTFVQDSVLRDNVVFAPLEDRLDTLFRAEVRDIRDLGVNAAWSMGALSLDGRVGRRWGTNIAPQVWWETHAALRITPMVALTVRTGRLASDALLSVRGGEYTTFGLRLNVLERATHARLADPALQLSQVVRESPTSVRLLLTMPPGTRQVTLVSDLTEWRVVALARSDDGRWVVVLPARLGVYRVNISADEGPWRVPPGLPATDDGFGAKVGLLVLER